MRKKITTLCLFLGSLVILHGEDILLPLTLLTPEQQEDEGYVRQRKMYPQQNRERISNQACLDGFKLLLKDHNLAEAMSAFNRAWRFNPENYAAYWGTGIIRGKQAEKTHNETEVARYLQESISLLEKAVTMAPAVEKCNAQLDLMHSLNGIGAFQMAKGSSTEAAKALDQAEKIGKELVNTIPKNGRAHFVMACTYFYKKEFQKAKQEILLATENNYPVPKDFHADVENGLLAGSH